MKKLFMLIGAVAGIGFAAFATDYTWIGAVDNNWSTPGNWSPSGCPQTSSDYARFSKPATVLVDKTGVLDVGLVILNTGATLVTLNGVEGAILNPTKDVSVNSSSFLVQDDCKLVVNLPVSATVRMDKWHGGEVEFSAAVTNTASNNPFVLDNGKVVLSGAASFSAENGDVSIGNYTNGDTATLELKDSASLTAKNIRTGINSTPSSAVGNIIQNGADTAVTVSGGIGLATAAGHDKPSVYELNAGALTVGGALTIGSKSKAQYVQTGGTSTVASVLLDVGSVASLRGGVMNCGSAPSIANGCTFEIENATLALTGASLSAWEWQNYDFGPGAKVALSGTSSLAIPKNCHTYDLELDIGAGKTVTVSSGAAISAPRGSTNAWKVTLNEGSILKLMEATARIATPLDLTVNGSGKIQMYSSASGFGGGYRGAVVAHRLVVDGIEQPKGRYNGNASTFLDAGTVVGSAASIFVPYIWTGAGADDNWNTAANWDCGAVPPSGAPVDISRASSITLDSSVTVSCIIAMPNGVERKTTVTGAGSVLLSGDGYACGLFVPEGCELVLDVDFSRSNNIMSLLGGGRVTLKKTMPSTTTGSYPLLVLDGELALSGVTSIVGSSSYKFINHNSANPQTQARVTIEDGTELSVDRLSEGYPGYPCSVLLRQTGGTITCANFWLQNVNVLTLSPESVGYTLEGGVLNTPAGIFLGNTSQVSANSAYPGGSFEMSGGTLNCGGFYGGCNQNYVRLYGGDVYLTGDHSKGNFTISRISDSYVKVRDENEITYYLGGVTIHPVDDYHTFSGGNIYLTGKNGDPTFDMSAGYNFAIMMGTTATITGPGGFVVSGPNGRTLTANGIYSNTGCITVKGGANVDFSRCTLNGPSKLVVEHVNSIVNFYDVSGSNPCIVEKSPDVIVLAAASCLKLQGQNLSVKRLTIGGVDQTPGTYTFTSGTVTVRERPASWLDGTVGDLSYEADGTTTTVDSATTLSSLTYDPVTAGETNTLAGAALTFADGANIHVEKGDTLVIGNDVVFAGKITKTGWGEVVFNGAVTSAVEPAADADNYWITVTEGGATFDGAVTGVRLMTCGAIDANGTPVITLKENCTVSNYGIVLTAWNEANVACCGETHQEGATVDYSTTVFNDLIYNKSNWALTQPRSGGHGRYVLDSGELRGHSSFHLSFVFASGNAYLGSFEFVQNGGTFVEPKDFMFSRVTSGVKFTYTLNGGRFEFGGSLAGYADPALNVLNLNGGTYAANGSDTIKRETFAFTTSGTVTFEVAPGKTLNIANDGTDAVSILKTGAGSLALDGVFCLDGLDVQSGTVKIGDKLQSVLNGSADLSIAKTGATLNLDYDGEAAFKTLTVDGRERGAGVYSVAKGPPAVKNVLAGAGELRILEGAGLGSVILIR